MSDGAVRAGAGQHAEAADGRVGLDGIELGQQRIDLVLHQRYKG